MTDKELREHEEDDRRWHERESLRLAIAVLATALVSLVGGWVAYGQNVVHENELRTAIETNSPYVRDRNAINRELDQIQRLLQESRSQLGYVHDFQQSLSTRVTVISHDVAEVKRLLIRHEEETKR